MASCRQPMHRVEDQRSAIADTIEAITELHRQAAARLGKSGTHGDRRDRSTCWPKPGIEYVADWVLDDQPVPLAPAPVTLISIPYTVEINDVVISAVQQQPSDEIFRRGRDQFDRLYLEGAKVRPG